MSRKDVESQAFTRMLSRDVASLVRAARQLSGYARDDVLRGDIDAAMQALGLLDVRLAGIDRFVADYLRYRRAGQRTPQIETFRVVELIECTWRALAPPPGAALNVNVEGLQVSGDRALLSEILREVLHNALVHHPDPGVLAVAVAIDVVDDARLVLRIHDNGSGIPQGAEARVFEPFVKLSGAAGACGLGLAWCQRALARAGGAISWCGAAAGGGVCVELPIGDAVIATRSRRSGGDAERPALHLV